MLYWFLCEIVQQRIVVEQMTCGLDKKETD